MEGQRKRKILSSHRIPPTHGQIYIKSHPPNPKPQLSSSPSANSNLSQILLRISLSLSLEFDHNLSLLGFPRVSMENNQNAKLGSKPNTNANNGEHVENPNSDCPDEDPQDSVAGSLDMGAQSSPTAESARPSSRTPFTNLSQVDADLALARTLQEQVFFPFSLKFLSFF